MVDTPVCCWLLQLFACHSASTHRVSAGGLLKSSFVTGRECLLFEVDLLNGRLGAHLSSSMSNHKHFVQENGCFSDAQALYVEQFSCPVLEDEAKCF